MKTILVLSLVAALAGGAAAQAPATDSLIEVDRIVAVVGSQPILWSDVLEDINVMRGQNQPVPTDSAGQLALARQIIGRLVDAELLVQKAKDEKIEVKDEEIAGAVEQRMKQVRAQFPSEEQFLELLRRSGFGTPEEYRRWLLEEQRRNALQERLFQKLRTDGKLPPAPVSDADVQEFFEKNRGQIPRLPATVTFRQIVIPVRASAKAKAAALARAESLLVEIRGGGGGGDFEQIAKRESADSSSRATGGDLGWRRRGDLVPEFEFIMLRLAPGQVSPVFETTFGYHIARVDRVQPAEIKVRHILIRPAIDSADIAATRMLADSIAAAWRAGAPYDSLAAKYHDAFEERSIPQAFPRAQLPEAYQQAFAGKSAGAILDPFQIEDRARSAPKFVIVELSSVEEERESTLEDFREQIRQQLAQERGTRRLFDTLRKATFVSVRM